MQQDKVQLVSNTDKEANDPKKGNAKIANPQYCVIKKTTFLMVRRAQKRKVNTDGN